MVEDLIAQIIQITAGGGLQGDQQVFAGNGTGYRGHKGGKVRLFSWHMGSDPAGCANIYMGVEIVHRSGTDGCRADIDRAGNDLDPVFQSQCPGHILFQIADHRGALDKLRELIRGDAAVFEQPIM